MIDAHPDDGCYSSGRKGLGVQAARDPQSGFTQWLPLGPWPPIWSVVEGALFEVGLKFKGRPRKPTILGGPLKKGRAHGTKTQRQK